MQQGRRQNGFTIIELAIVLVVLGVIASLAVVRYIDLRDEARQVSLETQAKYLIQQNELNFVACKVDAAECIHFSTTGFSSPGACQDAIDQFLPEAGKNFDATTYSSATPRGQWSDLPDDDEALFWVTRTVKVPHPQMAPCTLAYIS